MSHALLDLDADVGSDEDDDFDEDAPRRPKPTNGDLDDSSEEEDDDDEEAARKIREGFIVDEDEDEDEDDAGVKHKKRKRRRERDEEEELDVEDLELIGETFPEDQNRGPKPSKFKRLKQGHREERSQNEHRDIADIFSDEEEEEIDSGRPAFRDRGPVDEFADFIEEDDLPDEERDRLLEEQEVARPGRRNFTGLTGLDTSGLDESALEDYRAAFGDGNEYEWALDMQEAAEAAATDPGKQLELKDVFEPSQLAEKMLTDEDNVIRHTDVPERFQIARKTFKEAMRDEEETTALLREEAQWIMQMMWPKKRLERHLQDPFHASIRKMVEYFNIEDLEIPFIFQHRKDYLIHEARVPRSPSADNPEGEGFTIKAEKMLNQDDMWDILDLDLKWKGLVDKRESLQTAYKSLCDMHSISDPMMEELIGKAVTMEEIQDLQDYFHFQYSSELKDLNIIESDINGTQKRARAARNLWEKLRASRVYQMVRAFGISADSFAQNAIATGARQYTEDPTDRPDDLSDSLLDPPEYSTGAQILRAAKAMYAEDLVMSPRLRRYLRDAYYNGGKFDCYRTEKGSRQITEDHRYYEFKYLRNQDFHALARKPEMYLRMLQAEAEGLVEVKVTLVNRKSFREKLYSYIESDNVSDVADAWNQLRREVLDFAMDKLEKVISKGVKETLKAECENHIGKSVRQRYTEKLDQAPHKVKGLANGAAPRVLALSNGNGVLNRDAICWVYLEDDGRVLENGKFIDLRPGNPEKYLADGKDIANLVELVKRRRPDVIAVSGFAPETRKLYKDLQEIVEKNRLKLPDLDDEDDEDDEDNKLEVIMVNDEVARLYHTSARAVAEYPSYAPIARYTIGLARYVQNPMLEYAALGKNIISISFDPNQDLLSEEKLLKWLDTAMVDMVNLVGVNINDAASDPYIANLLPYVCGLGPRKAAQLLKVINLNGGVVESRGELVGDEEKKKLPAVGPKVWQNCASFFDIPYEEDEPLADYLDHTRIHPEDYDIARKMAADALELDEEDIKIEIDENGQSGVVRKLVKEEAQDKVNDLVLEEYAEQLERNFNQRKRATLETIRAELINPYEELRRTLAILNSDEAFTMMTGETEESLVEGMIVPVTIRRVFADHIECKLDSGLEGGIGAEHYPESISNGGLDPRSVYQPNQVVQAIVQFLNKRSLTCQLSLRDDLLRKPYKKKHIVTPGEWDEDQEEDDKRRLLKEKEAVSGRAQRVIKHPLFRPFNSAQAEEYLGSQSRGDVVIRPSSKGTDHLAVTWKVADNVYQHIDVLELDKDNEFALGRTLTISGKYKYSDLDELIVLHVKAMAKKVDEMMSDERYQNGSKGQTEQWLTTYTEANPKRSMYAFCINPKYPGYFFLCFKAGQHAPLSAWPVKVVPNAFEMRKLEYPDMKTLKNGFKLLFSSMQNGQQRR